MTNGDKIRQMRNDELAPILPCPIDMGADIECEGGVSEANCNACIRMWLNEEARDDDH